MTKKRLTTEDTEGTESCCFLCVLCALCGFPNPFRKISKSLECEVMGVAARVEIR